MVSAFSSDDLMIMGDAEFAGAGAGTSKRCIRRLIQAMIAIKRPALQSCAMNRLEAFMAESVLYRRERSKRLEWHGMGEIKLVSTDVISDRNSDVAF